MRLVQQQKDVGVMRCRLGEQTYEVNCPPGGDGWYNNGARACLICEL
jgi:hypothetical protein